MTDLQLQPTATDREPDLDLLRDELNAAAAAAGVLEQQPRPWALFGSAVLLLYGLRDRIGDVDVFAAPELADILAGGCGWTVRRPDPHDPAFLERVIAGVCVHVFDDWTVRDPEVSAVQCRATAVLVHGWWCTPLQIIRMHKAMSVEKHAGELRQAKHLPDIAAIDAYTSTALAVADAELRADRRAKRAGWAPRSLVPHAAAEIEAGR